MDGSSTPDEAAGAIAAARDRLVAFARERTPEEWVAEPLAATGDARSVGVLVDHVGHAYEYLASFIAGIVGGDPPQVDAGLIDRLNAEHAAGAAGVDVDRATARLIAGGDALVALVRSLTADQMELLDGRVRRLAAIAVRHADDHRTDLEEALAARTA